MERKIHERDGVAIDYTKSSVQVFPAIRRLKDSSALYIKFSNNHIKTLALQQHAELSLDFDLCLIDRDMNETVLQLFAIFTITKSREPMNDWHFVTMAIEFARSLLVEEIERERWTDRSGQLIQVPSFSLNPESINFSF